MPAMNQKLRTLYLMDIMLQRTDDQHLLNASQLCDILEQEYILFLQTGERFIQKWRRFPLMDWISNRKKERIRDTILEKEISNFRN